MKEIITAAVLFIMSAGVLILSVRSFREKGYLFNNAWIFASEKERAAMDKAPYYRQSGIVFLGSGIIFLLLAVRELVGGRWLLYTVYCVLAALAVYAVVSGAVIGKRKN